MIEYKYPLLYLVYQPKKYKASRMKRIIIYGLPPEYRRFIFAVQGWPPQPSRVEFENVLASQEAMAK